VKSWLRVSTRVEQLQSGEPTPWMGLVERFSSYSMLLWIVLPAIGLMTDRGGTIRSRPMR
jgi:hypothetical protein